MTKKDLKLANLLLKAYKAGSISLADTCPHCYKRTSAFDHGKCMHCKKGCGCSFNPTSSSDYCNFHGGRPV